MERGDQRDLRGGGRGRRALVAALALAGALTGALSAGAGADPASERGATVKGRSTVQQRVVPRGGDGFRTLRIGAGEGYVVRQDGIGFARKGRAARRHSIAYIGQVSDFQLADEESPARVEAVDPAGPPVDAAWRPWEALEPFVDDAMIRQVNAFADHSPLRERGGRRAPMDFVIDTGDSADSQQLNETTWVRTLLEGGRLDPNSGIDPAGYSDPSCPPVGVPGAAEAKRYTGVQDYDDYDEGANPYHWDPDDSRGEFAGFPEYPGLMDRAQRPFTAAGLDVPSYVAFGNHDGLVQGNQAANASIEGVAVGCVKNFQGTTLPPSGGPGVGLVPPDPKRQFVSKEQYKRVFQRGTQRDGHGFDLIDKGVERASNGAAGYYSFKPVPGLRMIALDTVSEGGVAGPSADGNIDDPQFQWLERQLRTATDRGELVVLFSHHAIASLTFNVPDEAAPPCTGTDEHGHDANPGCDVDPRSSEPIHLGDDMTELLHRYPNVVAWIAGHSHVNDIQAYDDPDGPGGFWMIRSAAEADWPQQARLVQIFDNEDKTLSIFGTVIDHASPATAPGGGTAASGMSPTELASLARTLAYNDNQVGARECDPACGEGERSDRNVELLLRDPRTVCTPGRKGTDGDDRFTGGTHADRYSGRGGADRIAGKAGGDCLRGQRGRDRIQAGTDADYVSGGSGRDRINGGGGIDKLSGGGSNDRIGARDGKAETVDCGAGRDDLAIVDRKDTVVGCERVRRG